MSRERWQNKCRLFFSNYTPSLRLRYLICLSWWFLVASFPFHFHFSIQNIVMLNVCVTFSSNKMYSCYFVRNHDSLNEFMFSYWNFLPNCLRSACNSLTIFVCTDRWMISKIWSSLSCSEFIRVMAEYVASHRPPQTFYEKHL